MNLLKKNIGALTVCILFFIAGLQTQGQDVIFSQNFLVPETLNTSFTGAIRTSKVGTIHKSQWRNSVFKTNSSFVYFDTWFEGYKTGLGISFLNQTLSLLIKNG